MSGRRTTKKAAPAAKKTADPLFPARPKSFRIGGDIRPKTDVSRFVRWPRYVRVQRQRKVLFQRLKVPPAINQFKNALDKNQSKNLYKLLEKYQPETKAQKRSRLREAAEATAAGKEVASAAPKVVKFGLNHVTTLIEQNKAQLVVIAADVDPIELIVWLPALCKKQGVPYVIVKNKGTLGQVVHQKKATAVCLTEVNKEDRSKLEALQDMARSQFNESTTALRTWGGGVMGLKTTKRLEIRARIMREEAEKKAMY